MSTMFPFFTIMVSIYKMKNSSLTTNALNDFIASAKPNEGSWLYLLILSTFDSLDNSDLFSSLILKPELYYEFS